MSRLIARRRVLVAIILVLLAVVATESVVLAAALVRQGSVEYMKVATENTGTFSHSTEWQDVPSTALAMPIPAGEHDFFQITFSVGAAYCNRLTAEASTGPCYVRALVDGQVASPGAVAFGDSSRAQQDLTHSMQWVSNVLAPGTHYVKIQIKAGATDNATAIYARTTTVIMAKAY